jgi:hypothetical protein
MAVQLSTDARTALAQALIDTIGASPVMRFRTGSPPANCAATRTGTVCATLTLPSTWATAASGALTMSGTWQDAAADATGTVGYAEILDSTVTTVHYQATVGQFATAWQATTAYTADDEVTNGNYVYKCITSGTSAGSGGPTGTASDITDNTAHWAYKCLSSTAANIVCDNATFTINQPVPVTTCIITMPGA